MNELKVSLSKHDPIRISLDKQNVKPQTEELTATENGIYTPSKGKYFDTVTVNVNGNAGEAWELIREETITQDINSYSLSFDKPYKDILFYVAGRSNNADDTLSSGTTECRFDVNNAGVIIQASDFLINRQSGINNLSYALISVKAKIAISMSANSYMNTFIPKFGRSKVIDKLTDIRFYTVAGRYLKAGSKIEIWGVKK